MRKRIAGMLLDWAMKLPLPIWLQRRFALLRIRTLRFPLQAGYKFNRDEANER